MFTSNPFAALSASISPAVMQCYVALMIVLVVVGTLFEVVHKGSARYFFENWRRTKQKKGAKPVGGGDLVSIAAQWAVVDVLASGEFCNLRRRIAHLLGMYGFVLYVLSTAVLVFDAQASAIWNPPPTAAPFTAAISGLVRPQNSVMPAKPPGG